MQWDTLCCTAHGMLDVWGGRLYGRDGQLDLETGRQTERQEHRTTWVVKYDGEEDEKMRKMR